MATYTNTNPPTMLEQGDQVIFRVRGDEYRYKVRHNHLSTCDYDNSKIFDVLGINKEKLCAGAYGYSTGSGVWPTVKNDDYAALTRAVWAIYAEIAINQSTPKIEHQFEVGMAVRVINKASHLAGCSPKVGDTGIVETVDLGDDTVHVQFSTGMLWASFSEVEPVATRTARPKVGQKVRIIGGMHEVGKTGRIIKDDLTPMPSHVDLGGHPVWCMAEHVEVVSECEAKLKAKSSLMGDGDDVVFELKQDGKDVDLWVKRGDLKKRIAYFEINDGGLAELVTMGCDPNALARLGLQADGSTIKVR